MKLNPFAFGKGSPVLCLEERRKCFVGFIFANNQCSSWLVEKVEAASQVKDDIAKSYRERDKVLMVHGVLIRLEGSWRCPFMQRVVVKESFGF